MKRRFLQKIILPIFAITVVIGLAATLALAEIGQRFRQDSNQEISALVGVAATGGDDAEIITNLRNPSPEQVSLGAELLRQYGYFPSDYASNSAVRFFTCTLVVILIVLAVFALIVCVYFCWHDWRRSQQIIGLIDYMQRLGERVYDLHLDENSEDELSVLSNELYKIMVLLREAADSNQKARQQLETALADISHQLRTPLTSMQVMVDNIYDDPEMPIDVRQDFYVQLAVRWNRCPAW